ncbi:MAG: GatB/YqeY domain-containing protein [Gammaproteobacteria bacterium]|nr:GatB/YqeY domain-containing protein [Gammaproteobacteria bacterium]
MSLKNLIIEDMKDAMRAGDKLRLGAIRMALAAIKQKEVDERITLDDEAVLSVLEKMLKQRRESITQFRDAGREDLAKREEAEAEILIGYMPEPLAEEELEAIVKGAISETGAESMRDMGKVMAIVKAQAQGRADMSAVSARVRTLLGS